MLKIKYAFKFLYACHLSIKNDFNSIENVIHKIYKKCQMRQQYS